MSKSVRTKAVDLKVLDEKIERLADLRTQEKKLKVDIAEVQDEVLALQPTKEYMTESGLKSTKVQKTKSTLLEDVLKKLVGTGLWNKITTRVLDKKKFDAYVASGEIKPAWVAESLILEPGTEYVNVTRP